MADNAKEVKDLLEKLKAAGATISSAPKPSSAGTMSSEVLKELDKPTADFTAWVSWSKSF